MHIPFELVIPSKFPKLRESGLLEECTLQILPLRFAQGFGSLAQDDIQEFCHPERSEGSMVDLSGITSIRRIPELSNVLKALIVSALEK